MNPLRVPAGRWFARLLWASALLTATIGGAVPAAAQTGALDLLVAQDVRLAAVGERLLRANAPLCRATMPVTGMILHGQDQYRRDVAGQAFANGPLTVAAVVPGSAAAALLAPGDGVASIGGRPVSALRTERDAPLRNAAFALLAALPPSRPVALTISRAGQDSVVQVPAVPGCRSLIELGADMALGARSDGTIIQVNYGIAVAATDEELAVVFAHELAHLVLEHRRRLEQAGIVKGILGELGNNQQRNREAEVEADRLSVHLLVNAGYDPHIAPAFWRSSLGRRASGGLLRSRIYPSPESRSRVIEQEISGFLGGGAPSYPGHLLARRDTASN